MKYYTGYQSLRNSSDFCQNPDQKNIVSIGNFDGVHLGHQEVIGSAVRKAKEIGGKSIIYTFRPHPHLALSSRKGLELIQTYDEKIERIATLGVDCLVEEPFIRDFSELSAEQFIQDVLIKSLNAHTLYVGYDFGFGKNRSGTLEMLKKACQENDIELHIAHPMKKGSEVYSSSRIRSYLKDGNVEHANALMGHPFFYRGLVERGNARGRTIGFRTANQMVSGKILIKSGVYATQTKVSDEIFDSVTNVGNRPTFFDADAPVVVETHLLDFDRDLYGMNIEVRFLHWIRDEVKFTGPNVIDQLKAQIGKDILSAKSKLPKLPAR